MSTQELIAERKKQRKIVEDLEQSINMAYRDHQGSHHTVMLVALTVITFIGGPFIHIYAGAIGALGLAAYSYYLLYLGRSIEKQQKKLIQEEQKIMDLDKRLNDDASKESIYA
ncbi:MAG: hypothetical protein AAGJ37_01820 [Pseudomonadota bacterium]